MRKERKQYRIVEVLPPTALTVAQYAKDQDISPQYIYELLRKNREEGKKIDFEMVLFKGINFVIPCQSN